MKLHVGGKLTAKGFEIILNRKSFPISYPSEIWKKYPSILKNILLDNVAYSSTLFLPQMHDQKTITYTTNRPLSETFLYKNGIYDMPICALVDGVSSLEYIKRFFNTQYLFDNNYIQTPQTIDFKKPKEQTAIIPFSFGKESLLNTALCLELGITPILVNFIEPSHKYEYEHKKKLMKKFEKEFNVKIYVVNYGPGIFRYGKYWNLQTELGWGLHTTDYVIMSLPFAHYFNASLIILGNEVSCNDFFFNKDGVLTYDAGYDQHKDWTPQQSLLGSLLLGREIDVASFVDGIYELAETKILQSRYQEIVKYQMSCEAKTEHAANKRWCQRCEKCSYMFALISAFDVDLQKIGFSENMFDKAHHSIYSYFFKYDPQRPAYGSQEALLVAFYLATKRGRTGYSIDEFKKHLLPKFEKNKKDLIKKYLGIHPMHLNQNTLAKKLLRIYRSELKEYL